MKLIVTEKDNAARRIADILSEGAATAQRRRDVNVYRFGETRVVGLSGHVVGLDFPEEYDNWRDAEPVELIDAALVTEPTQENIVDTLSELAARADEAVIATDYDREGELIGKEAYELIREVFDGPIERVRFSSITETEVRQAFASPEELDFDLAAAGEARQVIDLVWGAALTRFLSLSAHRFGDDFISVGRVQSPTLKLLVDREREIRAFDPETYWELFAGLSTDGDGFEAQYFYDDDGSEAERVWDGDRARSTHEQLQAADSARVSSVRRRTRTDRPPEPFDTTAFISAAGSLGYSAQQAMSLAEELYTAGYITYPRTDNTVYPDDLDPVELVETFRGGYFDEDATLLLSADSLDPTEGDEETTDHPPIHPTTELPNRHELSDDEWEVYELVVRRFFATVADPAEWAHLRVVATAGDHRLKANGKRLLEAGYHDVYPYGSTSENHLPPVQEGESLRIEETRLEQKETRPPRRYGQSRLIQKMEERGLGTKSTRHNVIEKLYDRGYVEDDPPRPTALAEAVVDATEAYAEQVVTEEMTAQLEADMDAIAAGEAEFSEVTAESKEMLADVFESLRESREEIGEHIQESLKADRALGPCPECGETLLVRSSRQGSYFVGCDGYPDCEFTLPLPSQGEPSVLDERCADHDLAHVKMVAGRNTFVHGCPRCAADAADESEDRVIGTCPECGDEHGGELAIKQLRSGSRLVGCTRYPDCEYSLPLPRRGDITVTETYCEEHDLPELVVKDGDDPWELGCPICNYREYKQREEGDDTREDADSDSPEAEDSDQSPAESTLASSAADEEGDDEEQIEKEGEITQELDQPASELDQQGA